MYWDGSHPNPPLSTTATYTPATSLGNEVGNIAGRGDFTYRARLGATIPGIGKVYSGWSASVACSVDSSLYWVTRGAYDGIMTVARSVAALPCRSPSPNEGSLSAKKLAAIMIAIAKHEVLGTNPPVNKASSPMALSVNETAGLSRFYYLKRASGAGYRAAYWYPGVGLWQLDWFGLPAVGVNATGLKHALQADTAANGGLEAAKMLQWMYCRNNLWTKRSENGLDRYWIEQTWAACESGLCKSTFGNIFVSESADLNVHIVEGWNDSDGGDRPERCRWSDGRLLACFLY